MTDEETLQGYVVTAFESIKSINSKANFSLNLTGVSLEKQTKLSSLAAKMKEQTADWKKPN